MTYPPEQTAKASGSTHQSSTPRSDVEEPSREGPEKVPGAIRRLLRAEVGDRTAGWQAGALFAIVGAISIANDVLPSSLGHGQSKTLMVDVTILIIGLIGMTLPWAMEHRSRMPCICEHCLVEHGNRECGTQLRDLFHRCLRMGRCMVSSLDLIGAGSISRCGVSRSSVCWLRGTSRDGSVGLGGDSSRRARR